MRSIEALVGGLYLRFTDTIDLLKRLKSGEVGLDQVEVHDDSWEIHDRSDARREEWMRPDTVRGPVAESAYPTGHPDFPVMSDLPTHNPHPAGRPDRPPTIKLRN